jgi:CRISPR-associated protein Csm1
MANHLPTVQQDGNPRLMTFEEIAQRSTGRPMLGFLKMDVDNLGELFVFGLKRSDGSGDRDTISRVTTLSRMLDTFFTGRIQHLLQEKFNNCYTVFSGGDDLLVLGPWNEVLDLAVQVNEDFHQWTGRPDITISGGVLLTHPRYPMYRAAQQVDAQLARSKEAGRNRFTAFGETRRWEQWIHLWTLSKEFMGEIQQVSSSALFRLKEYGDMWQRWLESTAAGKPDSLALKAQPLLAYTIGREGLGRSRLINEWARGLVDITPGADTAPGGFDDLSLISRLLILAKGGRVS